MNFIDKIVSFISPKSGAERARSRMLEDIYADNARKYDAAGYGKRNQNWKASSTSQNAEAWEANSTLRNRHRDMVRNNPYARKAVNTIANNVVGSGIKPSIKVEGSRAMKSTKKIWADWADKTLCDFDGRKTFAGIQWLVMKSVVESGEVFVRRRRDGTNKIMPLRIQVLEADFLDHLKDGISISGGGYIMQGIEFDSAGKRVAYWMYDRHPGENRVMMSLTSNRIPAEEILHIYHEERPGQIRGVPFGTSVMMRLKDFDEYEDSQLIRQKVAACFAAFVTDSRDPLPGETTGTGLPFERVEPGMIEYLPPGKSVSFATPPTTEGYDQYSRRMLQGGAAGYGITYESLTGDLSNVNFSSGRMGWIEMSRMLTVWQEQMLTPQLCDGVFAWFLEAGQIAGTVKAGTDVSWTPPARSMIDPVKETKGISEQVRNGFISWQEAVRQMGYDPDMIADELTADYKMFESLGLMLACDPRYDPGRKQNGSPPAGP